MRNFNKQFNSNHIFDIMSKYTEFGVPVKSFGTAFVVFGPDGETLAVHKKNTIFVRVKRLK
jgi:hypothetical protein